MSEQTSPELVATLEMLLPDKRCKHCKYMTDDPSEWCYMFEAPPTTACAQFTVATPPKTEEG